MFIRLATGCCNFTVDCVKTKIGIFYLLAEMRLSFPGRSRFAACELAYSIVNDSLFNILNLFFQYSSTIGIKNVWRLIWYGYDLHISSQWQRYFVQIVRYVATLVNCGEASCKVLTKPITKLGVCVCIKYWRFVRVYTYLQWCMTQ